MDFTYDSSGTGRQVQWVKDAIADCGYDLSLINEAVTVMWADQLPNSPDLGHKHTYMVTVGVSGGWQIIIEKWADDPSNPNNSGLPDPQNDIYGFYKESFVHELGHVVSLSQLTTTDLQQQACGLFWAPDDTGGSGKRYGTLDDWNSTVWKENIKEAVAETFKIVYYKGQLIFRNRTIWRLDQGAWVPLWKLLIPSLKAAVTQQGGADGQNFDFTIPDANGIGIRNLVSTAAVADWGPAGQPGFTPPNPGGTLTYDFKIYAKDPNSESTSVIAAATIIVVAENAFGANPGQINSTISVTIGLVNELANVPIPNGGEIEFLVAPSGNPNGYTVTMTGPGVSATGEVIITLQDSFLTGESQALFGGALVCPVSFKWDVVDAFFPPPYPSGPLDGSIGVGLGYRGAVILGH